MARATSPPPSTASEQPSQKSFCTSTTISARMGQRYPPDAGGMMAWVGDWNHNVHYQPVILRAVPAGCGAALEVDCGDGLLASRLAERCAEVIAIDLDA